MFNKLMVNLVFGADFVDPIENNDFLNEALETIVMYGMWICNLAIIGMLIFGLVQLAMGRKGQQQGMNDSGQAWIFRAIALGVIEVVAIALLNLFGIADSIL